MKEGVLFNRLSRESFVHPAPPAALIYHEIIRSGFVRHLEAAEPQRWRELHRRAADWWQTFPDDAEMFYHRLRADYAGAVELMKEAIAAALDAQDWPQAQTLIGATGDLALQAGDEAWLTLYKAELAWGEGNLPLVHRRVERLQAQPDLPPGLTERPAADLER